MIQSQTFLSVPKHHDHNPYSANLLGVLQWQCSHEVPYSQLESIAVKGLGVLHYTLIPSHCIQVDMERLLFSLAVKWHKSKNKKVINSYTKCLISVKIAILTPHTTAVGNVWLIFDLQKHVN